MSQRKKKLERKLERIQQKETEVVSVEWEGLWGIIKKNWKF
jgi:hypothetical protein